MPPHLHPRSAATSTLFAGTLLASFIVVGIPHVFPCPRPVGRKGYADTERKQKPQQTQAGNDEAGLVQTQTNMKTAAEAIPLPVTEKSKAQQALEEEAALFRQLEQEAEQLAKEARECPVPKPKGMLGRLLGFNEDGTKATDVSATLESKG